MGYAPIVILDAMNGVGGAFLLHFVGFKGVYFWLQTEIECRV